MLYTFANTTAFLLAPHLGSTTVEIGEVEEVLTDNAPLALQGALWELDQDIAAFASDETRLVATLAAFAEALMAKVTLRAQTAEFGSGDGVVFDVLLDIASTRGVEVPHGCHAITAATDNALRRYKVADNHRSRPDLSQSVEIAAPATVVPPIHPVSPALCPAVPDQPASVNQPSADCDPIPELALPSDSLA